MQGLRSAFYGQFRRSTRLGHACDYVYAVAHVAAGDTRGFCDSYRPPEWFAASSNCRPAPWAGSLQWEGEGEQEIGRRTDTGAVVVQIDPRYFARRKRKRCLVIPARQGKAGLDPSHNFGRADRDDRYRPGGGTKEAYLKREASR